MQEFLIHSGVRGGRIGPRCGRKNMELFQTPNMTPGEFFDRLTIVMRKAKMIPGQGYEKKATELLDCIPKELPVGLWASVVGLMMANVDIWNLEAELRMGQEGKLGYAEVGKRAIKIREVNARRIELVNHINKLFGVDEKEVKSNHASE
jgi:hypothetical protein